jgi:hypothetical protein
MPGLDHAIAGHSDGTKLLIVVFVSMVLGLRHATDPDHLAAVTTLLAARERTRRRAALLGLSWGSGHATTLILLGLPIIFFRAYLPEPVQRGAETAVGFMIIALAVALLVRWPGRPHAHVHVHDGRVHLHAHGHAHAPQSPHAHERPVVARSPLQAYGIGAVHGIGGSAGVGLLLLASIHNHAYAVAGLGLFALCTAVSMTLLTGLLGTALSHQRVGPSFARATPALAVMSLSFGVWYSLAALQVTG